MKTKLRNLLMQKGMTQKELSDKLGMSRQNFYNKLNTNHFTIEQLQTIASILGVTISYLTDETGSASAQEEDSIQEVARLKEKISYLEKIIEEKQKNILIMEDLIVYLKKGKGD